MGVELDVKENRLPLIPAEIEALSKGALDVVLKEIQADAKAHAPILDEYRKDRVRGALRESILARRRGLTGHVYTRLWYAHFLENGTVHNRAFGYMHKAADNGERTAKRVFTAALGRLH